MRGVVIKPAIPSAAATTEKITKIQIPVPFSYICASLSLSGSMILRLKKNATSRHAIISEPMQETICLTLPSMPIIPVINDSTKGRIIKNTINTICSVLNTCANRVFTKSNPENFITG